jgi:ssDNA-binding replication factor A large subunit
MQISEIRPEKANISVRGRILSIQAPQPVRSKSGKSLRVTEALLADKSGKIALTLWQNQIYKVKVNQVIDIKDGYASQYQGITKLTLGRNGTLEIVEDPTFPSMDELFQDLRTENQP